LGFPQLSASIRAVSAAICVSSVPDFWVLGFGFRIPGSAFWVLVFSYSGVHAILAFLVSILPRAHSPKKKGERQFAAHPQKPI